MRRKLSKRAQAVWRSLSLGERKQILKGNPFKAERNAIICRLAFKKVPQPVLAELSGLSTNQVQRIVVKGLGSLPTINELRRLTEATERLTETILDQI